MTDTQTDPLTDLGLSQKEMTFCEHYAVYANAKDAADVAGYNNPQQSGYYLLKKEEVQAYIKAIKAKAADVAGVTLIRNLKELAAIAYPVINDAGNAVYDAKPIERIKAIEVINKMCDFESAKKIELSGKDGAPIVVTGMVIKKE